MKFPGLFQILVIALIVIVLFGRGRISAAMGDFAKGIKGFKRNLEDDEEAVSGIAPGLENASLEAQPAADKPAG